MEVERSAIGGQAILGFFAPDRSAERSIFWPRWIFLRGLGAIFFSAFYALAFQIESLIGPRGLLPAEEYFAALARHYPRSCYWRAPTLLWIDSSETALRLLVGVGLVAAIALLLNIAPRASLFVCEITFLSFVSAAREFSAYQTDGMLLEAGFLAWFMAPPGIRPRLGMAQPPSRAVHWLLVWEWFRIYFQSGLAKVVSGDPQWRSLTALDHYYENAPFPTWIGWYAHQLPHWVHAVSCIGILILEIFVVWIALLAAPRTRWTSLFSSPSEDGSQPRHLRVICFTLTTSAQIGILLTCNYAFLNYLVLLLGALLLDDRLFGDLPSSQTRERARGPSPLWLSVQSVILGWVFLATITAFGLGYGRGILTAASDLLAPFRIANSYGLFAVMTERRCEIEFQASVDGKTWVTYPFLHKPQRPDRAPTIHAPYHPRFEWNLWFAALDSWENNPWVMRTQLGLLRKEPRVMELFASDPLQGIAPRQVRAVIWQYWFTDLTEKRRSGRWWRRQFMGLYAPSIDSDDRASVHVNETRLPLFHR